MTSRREALEANRRNWDERTAVHLSAPSYDLATLRAGAGRLNPIEEAELDEWVGPLSSLRVVHLQCHFGRDTLTLAQRGAETLGIDFSGAAVAAAVALAEELGLADRARFVESDVYAAPEALGEAGRYDLAFVTWGAIGWLPDIDAWARVVAHFLKPGGRLYLLEGHPAALVFDDAAKGADGWPGWYAPYLEADPIVEDDPRDYADPEARLANARTVTWMHGLGAIFEALRAAGLPVTRFREHDSVPWRMFDSLVEDADGQFRWPDRRWLPLAFSMLAEKV